MPFRKISLKKANIHSRAIAFKEFWLTPTPGVVHIDVWFLVDRDVTIRGIPSKGLDSMMKHFKVGEKQELAVSLMKSHFYGTPEQRGKMTIYNFGDFRGTLAIMLGNIPHFDFIIKNTSIWISPQGYTNCSY